MKTVLFLINGLGIETKDSFSVYNANLMPNFDVFTKKYLFSGIKSNVHNIYDGYRNMSLEINELYNYHVYAKKIKETPIINNKTYQIIANEMNERKSKLHLLVFIDTSLMIVENLTNFLKNINPNHDKEIYLHIVLTSTDYENYPQILDVLSRINIELQEEAKIGMVFGLETILNSNPITELNFFLKIMITEVGERWQSFKQKLDVSYGTKKAPSSVKPFVVNNGFSLTKNDMFLIWNYDNIDLTNFINGIRSIDYKEPNNIVFYSLFPITYKSSIAYFFDYEKAQMSLAKNMQGLGFKTLILTSPKNVNAINYYLNGLDNVNNPDITYLSIDNCLYDANSIVNIINSYPQELMIFNYDITSVDTIEKLEDVLKKIDGVLGMVYQNTSQNSYNIIISSLYGMEKNIPNGKGEICHVVYDKVPIIYISNFLTKKNYLINEGNVNDLFKVCYKSINKGYLMETFIIKKNFLYRLIFK